MSVEESEVKTAQVHPSGDPSRHETCDKKSDRPYSIGDLDISASIPLPKLGRVVTVDPHATVPQILDTLLSNKIRSAPIIHYVDGRRQIQLIEISDVLKLMIDTFNDDDTRLEKDLAYILKHSGPKEPRPSSEPDALGITNLSQNASFIVVAEGSSLFDISTAMGINGVRRVIVINSLGDIVNIITQTTVLNLLLKHRDEMKNFLDKTLFELEFGGKNVISVSSRDTALSAFIKLVDEKISSVAVLDENTAELIGSINVHDIDALVEESKIIKRLYERADEFIKNVDGSPRDPTIKCTPVTTIGEILDLMVMHNVHRVWVCNKQNNPLGIVTITDLLHATVMPFHE